jgi:hypothetical protein
MHQKDVEGQKNRSWTLLFYLVVAIIHGDGVSRNVPKGVTKGDADGGLKGKNGHMGRVGQRRANPSPPEPKPLKTSRPNSNFAEGPSPSVCVTFGSENS